MFGSLSCVEDNFNQFDCVILSTVDIGYCTLLQGANYSFCHKVTQAGLEIVISIGATK